MLRELPKGVQTWKVFRSHWRRKAEDFWFCQAKAGLQLLGSYRPPSGMQPSERRDGRPVAVCLGGRSPSGHASYTGALVSMSSGPWKVIARPKLQCHRGTVFGTHGWGRLYQMSSNPYSQPGWLRKAGRASSSLSLLLCALCREALIIIMPHSQDRCFKEF